MNYSEHKKKWDKCVLCNLCGGRKHVVLGKGKIPCDVLFIGEAPGKSEDILGRPFVGPAGNLLDRMISETRLVNYRLAFTNLVGCIPKDDNGVKKEPPIDAIRSCNLRLDEFVKISKPRFIVAVGGLARKYYDCSTDIIHPAAILRMDQSQVALAIKRVVISLGNLVERMESDEA